MRHSRLVVTDEERSTERRWVVVGEDGRYVTLGRASDPTETEILEAEKALLAQGLAGWVAVMQGNPYVGAVPRLMEVRRLGQPTASFESAEAKFLALILLRRQ